MKKSRACRIAAATLAFSAAAISPAFAHATLTETAPKDGADATDVSVISVTATEELLDLEGGKGFVLAVTDADGHFYGDGCVTVDGATASMPVVLGEVGEYSVAYRVVSADGHVVEGDWSFTYAPAPDAAIAKPYVDLPVCGIEQLPIGAPTPMPGITVSSDSEDATGDDESTEFDLVPFIGLATIPLIVGGIWVLMRLLGKRDSEDHLN